MGHYGMASGTQNSEVISGWWCYRLRGTGSHLQPGCQVCRLLFSPQPPTSSEGLAVLSVFPFCSPLVCLFCVINRTLSNLVVSDCGFAEPWWYLGFPGFRTRNGWCFSVCYFLAQIGVSEQSSVTLLPLSLFLTPVAVTRGTWMSGSSRSDAGPF